MKWITVETHTHTLHSDASLSVAELITFAGEMGLDAFFLTDHNTDSGMDDVPSGQANPTVLPGIEWTTFYGHVVILAPEAFVEWRDLTPANLDAHLSAVREARGISVMSHPCDPGEPFCCGCHWDFKLRDWSLLDAIEVWHEEEPSNSKCNAMTKRIWIKRLREGHRLTALSSTDWHVTFKPEVCFGVNYFAVDETLPLGQACKEAVRSGRVFFTAGPTVSFRVGQGDAAAEIGDTIDAGSATVHIRIDRGAHTRVWERYEVEPESIVLIANEQAQALPFPGYGEELVLPITARPGYLRLELHGKIHGRDCDVALTNPIYVRS